MVAIHVVSIVAGANSMQSTDIIRVIHIFNVIQCYHNDDQYGPQLGYH